MKCKHIVGHIAGEQLNGNEWTKKYFAYVKKIEYFNTTKKSVPHPGFYRLYDFCPNCGINLKE